MNSTVPFEGSTPPQLSHFPQSRHKIFGIPSKSDEFPSCTIHISKKNLETIKSNSKVICSSNDFIVAILWKCLAITKNFENEKKMSIAFPINIREKRDPPMPKGFVGLFFFSFIFHLFFGGKKKRNKN